MNTLKRIKYGLKLRTNEAKLMKEAVKLIEDQVFGYVELLINPQHPDITPFSQFDVEYVVHVPHENYGVNIGNPEQRDFTLKMIDYSVKCADDLDAKTIILHAGTDSLENAKEILSSYDNSHIVIENMPLVGLNGESCLGYDAESLRELTCNNRFGLCLDFGHAIKSALSLKIDSDHVLSNFMDPTPKIYHISDGDLSTEKDNHLDIGVGSFDFNSIYRFISIGKSEMITLETPRQTDTVEDDVKNISKLKKLFSSANRLGLIK